MDLTAIFNACILFLGALISAFVIPWIKSKTTAAERETLLGWVKVAVAAAEQLYDSTQGNLKKKYVVNYLQSKGYSVLLDDVENAIEAEVLRLHSELYGPATGGAADGGKTDGQ